MRWIHPVLLGCCVFAGLPLPTQAQSNEEAFDTNAWQSVYRIVAKNLNYELSGGGKATWVPKPVLSWDNPVRVGRTEGDFFVWLNQGRPVLVGTVFSYDSPSSSKTDRSVSIEFHALTESAGTLRYGDRQVWQSPANAIEPIPVDAPTPHPRRVQRMVQMRQLANRLRVTTMLSGEEQPLRMLPKPIYRFDESTDSESKSTVIDGAIFALVTGTDPETLIVIEALSESMVPEGPRWQLTAARFTDLPLTMTLEQGPSWELPPTLRDGAYFSLHRFFVLPTELGPNTDDLLKP